MLRDIDCSCEDQRKKFTDMVGDGVFKNLAMRVNLDKQPEPDSDVASFIDELKENFPCLHFKPIPPAASAIEEIPETLPATGTTVAAAKS